MSTKRLNGYSLAEVEKFCRVLYKPTRNQTPTDHARMNACIDPAVNRYNHLDDEVRDTFFPSLVRDCCGQ